MAITEACGPHCGIRSNAEGTVTREGHCDCLRPCHLTGYKDTELPGIPVRQDSGRIPMCERWYERSGGLVHWELA